MSICSPRLAPARVDFCTPNFGLCRYKRNMTSEEYTEAVLQAKEHILSGDIFQIVLSQRFERRTFADPFQIYRALRTVNPSPYMTYLQVVSYLGLLFMSEESILIFASFQARGCVLVASSPEILVRVNKVNLVLFQSEHVLILHGFLY